MGNSATTPGEYDDGGDPNLDEFDGIETLGYRVLGVQPNSPASAAGLVSFFDFIVGANGERLLATGEGLEEGEEYDDIDFPALLMENKGKAVELLVWNIKSQAQRFVDLTPSDDWGGAGLLGVTIRLDNYGGADERVIRILEVEPNSPASIAGLVPMNDYMLGTNVVAFESTETLAAVLHQHVNQIVELYVYNSESDVVRVTPLMPTLTWGGRGMLGAEVGTGYLHRLPSTSRDTHGSSVERKVRWVGNTDESNGESGTNAGNVEGTDTNPTSNGGAIPTNDTPLELEPHLEMEVENGEDRRPEDVSKQPHQLGEVEETTPSSSQQQQSQPSSETTQRPGDSSSRPAESSGGETTKAPSQPTVNDEQESGPTNEQQSNEAAAAAAMAAAAEIASPSVVRDTNGTLPQFPSALPPLPPPPQVSPSPRQSPTKVDAAALFSAPPPPVAGGSMLPPPPKMST